MHPLQPLILSVLTRRYNSMLISGINQNSMGCQLGCTARARLCLMSRIWWVLHFPIPLCYGRFIPTVPSGESGRECNIKCFKLGYSVFYTFCGGKKHRIIPDIFSPNEKKSFRSIEGKWNDVMHAQDAKGGKHSLCWYHEVACNQEESEEIERTEWG